MSESAKPNERNEEWKEGFKILLRKEITQARDALNRARDGLDLEAELSGPGTYTIGQLKRALKGVVVAFCMLKTSKYPLNSDKGVDATVEIIAKGLEKACDGKGEPFTPPAS